MTTCVDLSDGAEQTVIVEAHTLRRVLPGRVACLIEPRTTRAKVAFLRRRTRDGFYVVTAAGHQTVLRPSVVLVDGSEQPV